MSLDGLRAWIGEVERKLGMRTRVFLVLTVIAIGGAGAAIYLAVDARDNSVSESDVQALQEKLETRIGEGGGAVAGSGQAQLEAELKALQAQVEQLDGESGSSGQPKGATGGGSAGGSSGGGSHGTGGSGGGSSAGTSGPPTGGDASHAKLQELLERAEKQNKQDENEQGHD
jgi:hypothetical protein